ncbi:M23 family metallopeptidase [Glacieibacterium sp.]|uniref:M23 family metallopeptidase n=1 Tax=Glacieibacterium sp. TaxID=2860237 RepID=UPI003B009B8C
MAATAEGYFHAPGFRSPSVGGNRVAHRLSALDLRIDLGDRIGSRDWWRGAATVIALTAVTIFAGTLPVPLPVAVDAPMTAAQADDARPDTILPLALGGTTGRFVAPGRQVEAMAEAPERPRIEATAEVRRSDSFEGALRRAGVGKDEANDISRLVGSAIPVRSIKPGTDIDLVLGRRDSKSVPRPVETMGFRASFDLRLELARADDGALALKRIPIAVDDTPMRVSGTVGSGLAKSARAAGVPAAIVSEAIQQLGYAVDFQHGVGKRDRFDFVVAHRRAETGETQTGALLYAGLDRGKGDDVELLRWTYAGKPQFFRATGESARKGLMRTPVDGAHLTSNFGMRFHPLLNYSRLHQGVDFGAASGSPIMAAAAGTISFAGWHGGHGNYVMVKHNGTLSTAYAHMSRFAVKAGQTVAQGQVIGYVGSTGLSTGPHLHYEIWLKGAPVNPLTLKFLGGTQLAGPELARFKAELGRMRSLHTAGAMSAGEVVADAVPAEAQPGRKRRG